MSAAPYESLNLAGHVGDDEASVHENRQRLADAVGSAVDRFAVMSAVHGADVAVVTGPGTYVGVDALVTQQAGVVLLALGADCVPIAVIGSNEPTIAVAHCGWRGLASDVIGAAVDAVCELGTDIATVVLGPSICGACYPVPEDRAREIERRASPAVAAAALTTTAHGQPGIDVREGLRARLAELGVRGETVVLAGGCTAEEAGLFSFRRDGVTGRQGMAVCIEAMMGQ